LEFRQQVGRLGQMEGAGGDEQDVVGFNQAIFGVDRRSLDQRQQVACTPSRLTSPPRKPPSEVRAQILSISSRKTMPLFSAWATASL